MYSKINNSNQGKRNAPYFNKGSSQRLVSYFQHEAKGIEGAEQKFFSNEKDHYYNAEHVVEKIDNNRKTLRKDDAKFYSLVLSPSHDELEHIKNDKKKLEAFTREAMSNYAKTFNLKDGKKLSADDLVWYATIHENRKVKDNDPFLNDDKLKTGDLKKGENAHIHIIVSRMDKEQKISLSPETKNKKRFYRRDWFRSNAYSFNKMFNYTKGHEHLLKYERNRIGKRIEGIVKKHNLHPSYLSPEKVIKLAEDDNFSKHIDANINKLDKRLKHDNYPKDAHHYIKHGSDIQMKNINIINKDIGKALNGLKKIDQDYDTIDFELAQIRRKQKIKQNQERKK